MKESSLTKQILTSAAILLVAAVVIVVVAIGMGAVGIPLWPFIIFLFFFTAVEGFHPEKLKTTAVSGVIGIFIGMSQGILTQLTDSATIGLVCFVILMVVFCTAFIMGTVPWSNAFGVLVMTLLTLFSLEPCVWAGIASRSDMGWTEAFVRVIISYALAVLLLAAVAVVVKKKAPSTDEDAVEKASEL